MTDLMHGLPKGTRIDGFEVRGILGHGGFGITYLGHDLTLDMPVAIKEYMPVDLAVRTPDLSVHAKSTGEKSDFDWGLNSFLAEARTVARFDHPNIVRVLRFFEQHGTAYIVLDYVPGDTLSQALALSGTLKFTELSEILDGVLDGLQALHESGVLHRDIKPGNIILREARGPFYDRKQPVLIDFGAARQMVGAKSRSLTAIVTPGYAPIEQYSTHSNSGPWTDIYALGAVAYRAITGAPPPDAINRVRRDPFSPLSGENAQGYPLHFISAVNASLHFDEEDRPQSVAEFRAMLSGEAEPEAMEPAAEHNTAIDSVRDASSVSASSANSAREEGSQNAVAKARRFRKPLVALGVSALIAIIVAGIALTILPARTERLAWEEVLALDTPAAYSSFIASFPSSDHRDDAENALRRHQEAEALSEEETAAWSFAQSENSSTAYESFLTDYPDGMHAAEAAAARDAALEIERDDAAWSQAVLRDSVDGYETYILSFPNGSHADEAEQALAALNAEAESELEAARLADDDAAWANAVAENSWSSYMAYRSARPDGRHSDEAFRRATDLSLEAWQDVAGADTIASYRDYIDEYPGSIREGEARARLAALEVDEDAWSEATRINTEHSFQTYLNEQPQGRHRVDAEAAIAGIREEQEAQAIAQDGAAWAEAQALDSWSGYLAYRASQPDGAHFREALSRATSLSVDAYTLTLRIDTIDSLEAFLADYPGSAFEAAARERLAALQADQVAWDDATSSDTETAYQSYLQAQLEGRFREEAAAAINSLTSPDLSPLVQECDRLAGHPSLAQDFAPIPPVPFAEIDAEAAIAACQAAVNAYPDHQRSVYQLIRSADHVAGAVASSPVYMQALEEICDTGATALTALGCRFLGYIIRDGEDGHPPRPEEAAQLFRRACEIGAGNGSANACNDLGNLQSNSSLGSPDANAALESYARACDLGEAFGCSNAAQLLRSDEPPNDYAAAFDFAERGCEMNDGEGTGWSCYRLGGINYRGEGLEAPDYEAALDYFVMACELGVAIGCHDVGWVLRNRDEVLDAEQSLSFYELGCELGNGESCRLVGVMLVGGETDRGRDQSGALEAYRLGCSIGDQWSCLNAAYLLDSGPNSLRNPREAQTIYSDLCDVAEATAPVARACLALGEIRIDGNMSPANLALAADAFEQGCLLDVEGESEEACYRLAGMYVFGSSGREPNEVLALGLFRDVCDGTTEWFTGEACYAAGSLAYQNYLSSYGREIESAADAARYFLASCELDNADACGELARVAVEVRSGIGSEAEQIAADALLSAAHLDDLTWVDWFGDLFDRDDDFHREIVRILQRVFTNQGNYSGAIDGLWGPNTRSAFNFQQGPG
ncbi:serine/threonine-protein kinase [Nioella ostreopsis]|uniref:serine/threonine-protein kinase n=1 Tax=Nioella ostreopsis TaxID=2448479 RepID=UPI000FD77F92|nr:serine/threonine-protein kinase [Nioella ostreopsis]